VPPDRVEVGGSDLFYEPTLQQTLANVADGAALETGGDGEDGPVVARAGSGQDDGLGVGQAEPGRYRTARTPYMREIMDRLSPGDPTSRIVFMKAAQVGATEAGNNWIGFVIHQASGPMLAVQPTVELAKRNSRQRIDPLIDESPELQERVKPARSRDAGNTMLSNEFAGGILIMTGAN
jgi:hypothetical protein